MEIQFNIFRITKNSTNDLVIKIDFVASNNDDDNRVEKMYSVYLPEKDVDDPNFVAYKNITKETAEQWILEVLSRENIQSDLEILLQQKNMVVSTNNLPWVSN
jgi:hypothetical protein